jgi:hypothetical protein
MGGVSFALAHDDLAGWVTSRDDCTFGAGLLPPVDRDPDAVDARLDGWAALLAGCHNGRAGAMLALCAGDVVSVSSAGTAPSRATADPVRQVTLAVNRRGVSMPAPRPALFWPEGAVREPRSVRSHLIGASREYASTIGELCWEARDNAVVLGALLPMMADAWAFAGYAAARQEYADALTEAGRKQTEPGRAKHRAVADRDRDIAQQFLLEEQRRGGISHLSRGKVARHVLNVLRQAGEPSAERDASTVIANVTPLFERRPGRSEWSAKRV